MSILSIMIEKLTLMKYLSGIKLGSSITNNADIIKDNLDFYCLTK